MSLSSSSLLCANCLLHSAEGKSLGEPSLSPSSSSSSSRHIREACDLRKPVSASGKWWVDTHYDCSVTLLIQVCWLKARSQPTVLSLRLTMKESKEPRGSEAQLTGFHRAGNVWRELKLHLHLKGWKKKKHINNSFKKEIKMNSGDLSGPKAMK